MNEKEKDYWIELLVVDPRERDDVNGNIDNFTNESVSMVIDKLFERIEKLEVELTSKGFESIVQTAGYGPWSGK